MNRVAAELKTLMLRRPQLTLAAAESLTAGHVQARIAAVSGSSAYFRGGVTAYSLDQKVRLLGVNRAAAKKVNCVSAAVAEQMAVGALKHFGAKVAVATTGFAEPSPADGVAVPHAWWAVAWQQGRAKPRVRHGFIECHGAKRTDVQAIVAEAVLTELVAWLREVRG